MIVFSKNKEDRNRQPREYLNAGFATTQTDLILVFLSEKKN